MTRTIGCRLAVALACLAVAPGSGFAEDAIATVVHARTGNGYKREMTKKGTFKPEYYALSNGGRVKGTAADLTVDKVSFPDVAGIAMRLLSQQNYHYAQREDQAGLLLVIQWGNTIAPNGTNKEMNVNAASSALTSLLSLQREFKLSSSELAGSGPSVPFASTCSPPVSRSIVRLPVRVSKSTWAVFTPLTVVIEGREVFLLTPSGRQPLPRG